MAGKAVYRKLAAQFGAEAAKERLYGGGGAEYEEVINPAWKAWNKIQNEGYEDGYNPHQKYIKKKIEKKAEQKKNDYSAETKIVMFQKRPFRVGELRKMLDENVSRLKNLTNEYAIKITKNEIAEIKKALGG
jgi:hypothetical protein